MKKRFNLLIVLSLVLGVLGGVYLPEVMKSVSFLGTIYINLLKFMMIPVIVTSIMVTIYHSTKERNHILLKTMITFIIMFVVTFLLTTLLVLLFNPAKGAMFDVVEWDKEVTSFNVSEIIVSLFPSNIVTMIGDNAMLPCILVAFFMGLAAAKVENGKQVIDFADSLKSIFYKLIEWVMYLTPIGVFSLVGSAIANFGVAMIGISAKYIGVAYLCSFLTLLFVMILPAWLIAKISPVVYIKNIWRVWLMTMTTCSSAATLPYAMKVCDEKFKIPNKATDIVMPLGCTIHKCGGAVSFALLALFCSQLFGIPVTVGTYAVALVGAILINMSVPGMPGGGIAIGATYLSMLNIPLLFIGVYSGIYRLLDMAYTTLNVTGSMNANILMNEIASKKNEKE